MYGKWACNLALAGCLVADSGATVLTFSGLPAGGALDSGSGSAASAGSVGADESGGYTPDVDVRWSVAPAAAEWKVSDHGGAVRLEDNGTGESRVPAGMVVFDARGGRGVHLNELELIDLGPADGGHVVRIEVWGDRIGGHRLAVLRRVDVPASGARRVDFAGAYWPGRVILVIKHLAGEPGALGLDDLDFDQRAVFTVTQGDDRAAPGGFEHAVAAATATEDKAMVAFDPDEFGWSNWENGGGVGVFVQPSADLAVAGLGHTTWNAVSFDVPPGGRLYLAGVIVGTLTGAAGSEVEVARCRFERSELSLGVDLELDSCDFVDSRVICDGASSLVVRACRFAEGFLGYESFEGPGITARGVARVRVEDCGFYRGDASGGMVAGGVVLKGIGDAKIDRCYFYRCGAWDTEPVAGALFVDGDVLVTNSTFSGGDAVSTSPSHFHASVAHIANGTATFSHCTFANQRGIFYERLMVGDAATIVVQNCIEAAADAENREPIPWSIELRNGATFSSGGGNCWQLPFGTTGWVGSDQMERPYGEVFENSRTGFDGVNGGYQPTLAPSTDSIALGAAGVDAVAGAADACLRSRFADGAPDAGAVELHPDSDGDGMDDEWEGWFRLDPHTDDSGLDLDGDGANNLAEYHSSTDPRDSASRVEYLYLDRSGVRAAGRLGFVVRAEAPAILGVEGIESDGGPSSQWYTLYLQSSPTGEQWVEYPFASHNYQLQRLHVLPFFLGKWVAPFEQRFVRNN